MPSSPILLFPNIPDSTKHPKPQVDTFLSSSAPSRHLPTEEYITLSDSLNRQKTHFESMTHHRQCRFCNPQNKVTSLTKIFTCFSIGHFQLFLSKYQIDELFQSLESYLTKAKLIQYLFSTFKTSFFVKIPVSGHF